MDSYLVQSKGGAAAPYAFRKSQFAARMYAPGGSGAAANTTAFCNGQTNTSGFITSRMCCDAEAPFTQVALIFGNVSASTFPISGASVAAGATLNDPMNGTDAARTNFVQILFGGLPTATVPAGTTGAPGLLVSDFANLNSVPRQAGDATTWSVAGGKLADCFTRPLLHISVAQPITAVNTPLLGYGFNGGCTDAPFNPRQPTKTGRYISVAHASDATVQTSVGAANALTGTVYGPFSGIVNLPVIGMIFKYATNAMCVMVGGDSITFGASVGVFGPSDATSPGLPGRSWASIGPEVASTIANPIEHCQLGVSGSQTPTFLTRIQAAISAGIVPTHVVYASFSPNDGSGGPGAPQLATLNSVLSLCSSNNIYPLTWTGLPVGLLATQKLSSAGEAARLAWNTSMRAKTLAGTNLDYIEMDQAGDGSGQIMSDNGAGDPTNHIASITSSPVQWCQAAAINNLHPNYTGDGLAMRPALTAKCLSLAAAYFP